VARVRERDGEADVLTLARDHTVEVDVELGARGVTWLTFE
jgi:hypothetical protein